MGGGRGRLIPNNGDGRMHIDLGFHLSARILCFYVIASSNHLNHRISSLFFKLSHPSLTITLVNGENQNQNNPRD